MSVPARPPDAGARVLPGGTCDAGAAAAAIAPHGLRGGAPLDRYAVVGNPVQHSQSPFIHAAFAEATGQALHYGRLLSPFDGFEATLRSFIASTDGPDGEVGPARGCNVTVPFKFLAHDLAARRSERAALAQAANTLRFDDGHWLADNTDGAGLVQDIQHNAGIALGGRRVLLLGAGGAAAGALGPLIEARPAQLRLVNRTASKARELVQRHAGLAGDLGVDLTAGGLVRPGSGFDVVINASASSLQGSAVPLPGDVLRTGGLAFDMMYGPATAGFLRWAESNGGHGRDGLGMLVEQAALAFRLWRGVSPPTAEVLAELRRRIVA